MVAKVISSASQAHLSRTLVHPACRSALRCTSAATAHSQSSWQGVATVQVLWWAWLSVHWCCMCRGTLLFCSAVYQEQPPIQGPVNTFRFVLVQMCCNSTFTANNCCSDSLSTLLPRPALHVPCPLPLTYVRAHLRAPSYLPNVLRSPTVRLSCPSALGPPSSSSAWYVVPAVKGRAGAGGRCVNQ